MADMVGHPDGLINHDGLIEIKSVLRKAHFATLNRGGFDPAYKWQLVGALDGTGRDWIDFVSYLRNVPTRKTIDRLSIRPR